MIVNCFLKFENGEETLMLDNSQNWLHDLQKLYMGEKGCI